MPSCPNCGRETLRTLDWACQWCGYPLVSRAFKKIDKTFKELQIERSLASRSARSEEVPVIKSEDIPEVSPPVKPVYNPVPEPEPAPPEPEPEVAPETVSAPAQPPVPPQPEEPVIQLPPPEPRPDAPPQAETTPELEPAPSQPEPEPVPEPEPAPSRPEPEPAPEPEAAPSPEPLITPPPQPKQELPPTPDPVSPPSAPKTEVKNEPEPAPEAEIKLEEIQDGMKITAEQIDTLFKADRSAANSKFVDKTLIISGVVEKVFIREHLDLRYIILTSTQKKMMWGLRCTFEKDESPKFARLSDGESVIMRGKYDGYSKNIIFKECELL